MILEPNWPSGVSRLMFWLPTKFWAMPMMVACRLASPWWYAALELMMPCRMPT